MLPNRPLPPNGLEAALSRFAAVAHKKRADAFARARLPYPTDNEDQMKRIVQDEKGRIIGANRRPRPVTTCDCGDHAFTEATRGLIALVSTADRALLEAGAVWAHSSDGKLYAARRGDTPSPELLHQIILPCDAGTEPDHENGNGLDNRRGNLRSVTRGQNNRNRLRTSAKSGYRGVIFHRLSGLWRAFIVYDRRQISCGYFTSAEAAAKARDAKLIAHNLTTAKLNFPKGENHVKN